MDANAIIAAAAVAQAVATAAAIYFTWSVARDQAKNALTIASDQAKQAAELKAEDRAREGAARDARARVTAFRLHPLVEEILRSLDHLGTISTNNAMLSSLLQTCAMTHGPQRSHQAFIAALRIGGGWEDGLYGDFDTLPPTLAQRTVLLLYKVEEYNRSLDGEVNSHPDLQALAAVLHTKQADIRATLNIVRGALHAFAPAPTPAGF